MNRTFSGYKCEYCDRAFARSNGRTKHYALEHKDVHQVDLKSETNHAKSPNSRNNMERVPRIVALELGEILQVQSNEKYELDTSRKSPARRYQCGTCLQLFTAGKHLRQHETLHTGEKRNVPLLLTVNFVNSPFH